MLYSQLVIHQKKDYAPFHTPGHKNAGFFPPNLLSLDFTELPDTDALYEAQGAIQATEHRLAQLFEAKRSVISAGGCTLAIQAMLRLASQRGKKLLLARNSHRSAVNACALLGITPQWILPQSEDGFFTGRISPQDVEQALKDDNDITALYVTSPNYYGELADIPTLAAICHQYGKLLLVDNAHGSHLAFLSKNQHPLHLGADMSACSLHKTLPVLTGGAVLNIGNESLTDNAKSAMSLFGSTSPSYPVMASIDLCCDYMEREGIQAYRQSEERVAVIRQLAAKQGLLQPSGLCDPLRICIRMPAMDDQTAFFHAYGIEPEFCDGRNAVFICTPFNRERDFQRLETALAAMQGSCRDTYPVPVLPPTALSPREAVLAEQERIPTEQALGRIAGESVCPCPPGIPVVMPGEVIDRQVMLQLQQYHVASIQTVKS